MNWNKILAFLRNVLRTDPRFQSAEKTWRYFTGDEVKGLSKKLVDMLDYARSNAGMPFIITSGLRTKDQNSRIKNAVPDSAHISGQAVDLSAETSAARYAIVSSLLEAGFHRIGIYDRHIHIDIDDSKPHKVIWVGKSK